MWTLERERIYNFYSKPTIFSVIKSRRISWASILPHTSKYIGNEVKFSQAKNAQSGTRSRIVKVTPRDFNPLCRWYCQVPLFKDHESSFPKKIHTTFQSFQSSHYSVMKYVLTHATYKVRFYIVRVGQLGLDAQSIMRNGVTVTPRDFKPLYR